MIVVSFEMKLMCLALGFGATAGSGLVHQLPLCSIDSRWLKCSISLGVVKHVKANFGCGVFAAKRGRKKGKTTSSEAWKSDPLP